jgi:hypothetical protein
MNQVIQIIIGICFLSTPVILFWFYVRQLEKKSRNIVEYYLKDPTDYYSNLRVWVKNFDVFKRTQKFSFDPFDTLYSFNHCDLVFNGKNFVVIGKMKVLGRLKPLNPTIFEFGNNLTPPKPRHVRVEQIQEVGSDLEIVFSDPKYENSMTLVIKKASSELIKKIKKTGYNNG